MISLRLEGEQDPSRSYRPPSIKEPLFKGGLISGLKGKTKDYTIETYHSNGGNRVAFSEMPEYSDLVRVVTDLYLSVYPNRDRRLSIERMRKGLSHPRTILMLARHEGIPVGFGLFPRLLIYGEQVVYSSRAFKHRHESEGLGSYVLGKGIEEHRKESLKAHRSLRWAALMTQNPYSVLTAERLPDVDVVYPLGKRFDQNREAQWYLLGVHHMMNMASLGIDTVTGVSRGELREIGMNERGRPDRRHARAWEIYQQMISPPPKGLGMNREAGDVVYVLLELKRPEVSGPGTPLPAA